MLAERIPQLRDFSLREKLELANELWDEVEARQQELPFDDAVFQLLERRFAAYQNDPATASTWQEFRQRLGKS